MAHQQGANVKLVIDTETVYAADPTPDGMVLPFKSESLRMSRNLISSATIRSGRNPQQPARGNMDVAGEITFELTPQYGRLLKHVFGSYGVAGGAAPYTHTYKIAALPVGMLIEKQFTDLATAQYFKYNGLRVNNFKLGAKAEGIIECSVGLIGAKETVGTSAYDATLTDLGHTPFDGFECSIKEGGSAIAIVTEIEFTLENNLDGSVFVIGGAGQRASLPAGSVKVSGTLTALFDSVTLYTKATGHTESALEIIFTKGAGTGASAGNEKLTFFMDELIYKPQAPVVPGPKGVMVELPFEAYYDNDADASALRAVLLSPIAAF
jgi:hypothetical protein